MSDGRSLLDATFLELVAAIDAKLSANSGTVQKSLDFGRLTWRRRPGKPGFEVSLEPKL
jgi:hypothetical protein